MGKIKKTKYPSEENILTLYKPLVAACIHESGKRAVARIPEKSRVKDVLRSNCRCYNDARRKASNPIACTECLLVPDMQYCG